MNLSPGILLVQVKVAGRRGFVIPFPLFVAMEALQAVAALVRLRIMFGRPRSVSFFGRNISLKQIADVVDLPYVLLQRLRDYGPLTFVDVHQGGHHISVRII